MINKLQPDDKRQLAQLLLLWIIEGQFTHVHIKWLLRLAWEINESANIQLSADKPQEIELPF